MKRNVLVLALGGLLCLAGCGADSTTAPAAATPTGEGGATSSANGGGGAGGNTSASSGMTPSPGCGDGVLDAELGEECDDGNDNAFDGCLPDCSSVDLVGPPALEWTYYEVEGTRCMDGDPAGFGISYNPDSPNVMLYLEGGGACFSEACDFTAFSIPFVPPIDGVFNRDAEVNPVRDWTMIYVPYCSGDIHAGDNVAELGGQERYFEGYRNITRFLERLVPSLPHAETVLLTGISAGGFGSGVNARQVADAFGDDVQMVVVDDSGPPMSDAVIAPCLQQIFRETWGLDDTVLAGCPNCDPHDFATGLFEQLDADYPNMRIGLFSNSADLVIRAFMGAGWGDGEHDNCEGDTSMVPADTYDDELMALRSKYESRAATFYVGQNRWQYNWGRNHTVLRFGYYSTTIDGVGVPEWLGQVIAGDVVHVGP